MVCCMMYSPTPPQCPFVELEKAKLHPNHNDDLMAVDRDWGPGELFNDVVHLFIIPS